MYQYVVLGAGRQGLAIAYDLGKHCQASDIILADKDQRLARVGAARVNRLLGWKICRPVGADASNYEGLAKLFSGTDGVVSAVPYYLNLNAAMAAISARAHFCDLGGNTGVVLQELELYDRARRAGVSVVPDTGLMPGMGNTIAVWLLDQLDKPLSVKIRCGGLPQKPKPPLNYKLVFSVEGLINEYFGTAYVIRQGKTVGIPTFSELEEIDFPKPLGRCQAFVTSGGTSTCPWTLAGRVRDYDYKTVRYPGHYEKIKALLDLGFFGQEPVTVDGKPVVPRKLSNLLIGRKIDFPKDPDLAVLRVSAFGTQKRRKVELRFEMIDYQDPKTGFTAMERTTGFPAAIVAHHLVRRLAPAGAVPLELAINPEMFMEDFRKRGIPFTLKILKC
jgi:lysine 6-dehydrogenase